MKIIQSILLSALLVGMLHGTSSAQDSKFSGYMFGDYYWFAGNHEPEIQDRNGFWLRRVYFTYDKILDESFSTRLRLEMANPDGITKSAG
ncbi:MAG: hypothetical protein ACE5I1_01435, partial [bacterium]